MRIHLVQLFFNPAYYDHTVDYIEEPLSHLQILFLWVASVK